MAVYNRVPSLKMVKVRRLVLEKSFAIVMMLVRQPAVLQNAALPAPERLG